MSSDEGNSLDVRARIASVRDDISSADHWPSSPQVPPVTILAFKRMMRPVASKEVSEVIVDDVPSATRKLRPIALPHLGHLVVNSLDFLFILLVQLLHAFEARFGPMSLEHASFVLFFTEFTLH